MLLVNIILAANAMFGVTKEPSIITNFWLDTEEIIETVEESRGKVNVEFTIDERGRVGEVNVVDTFDIRLNHIVRRAVKDMRFSPAFQNGRPVKVRYTLPIVVK